MGLLRAILGLVLVAGTAGAEPDWHLVWFPQDDAFLSWADEGVGSGLEFQPSLHFPKESHRWELAVCSSGDPATRARSPLPEPDERNESWLGWRKSFLSGEAAREFQQKLGAGTFLGAVLADGKRCSNVVRLFVGHDPAREPVVRLVPIQPMYGGPFTHVGIVIVPPLPQEAVIRNGWPDVEVDGIWQLGSTLAWSGGVYRLPAGRPFGYAFFLRPFTYPREGVAAGTLLRARVRSAEGKMYLSAPLRLELDSSDADRFDHVFGLP